jgi:hypothetical protein
MDNATHGYPVRRHQAQGAGRSETILEGENAMRCRFSSIRSRLTALAVLAGMLVLLAGCQPTPTPPPASFDYLVRVRDSAGATLPNAKVTIEVPGRTPLDEFADVNGLVVITIPATHTNQTGKLIAEVAGFEIYRQIITLQPGLLPDEIRLLPRATPLTPTEVAAATPAPAILNLHDGDLAAYGTTALGEYPAGLKEIIRVFVAPRLQSNAEPTTLYPQSSNPCKGNDGAAMKGGRWEQHIQVGLPKPEDVGLRFDVVLTTATAEGNAAVEAEMQRWCDEKDWKGFAALPAGVSEVARVTVTRSDEGSHAPDPSNAQLQGVIRITNPRGGQAITDEEVISGIYSSLPADHTIWLLVFTTWGKWFPQSSDPCNGVHTVAQNGQWQVTGSFKSGEANEPFDVVAVVADKAAGDFFDQKQREWCAQDRASSDFKWPGLLTIELPSGISEKSRIQVIHTDAGGSAESVPVVPRCAIPVPCEGCKTFAYTRSDACPLVDLQPSGAACIDEFLVQPSMPASSIRLDMLQRAESNYGYSLYEVEAYADGAADNFLPNSGSTAEASSAITPASRAIDGIMPDLPDGGGSSRWESEWQKDPQWLAIALSDAIKARPINRIVLKWERAYARGYCVTLRP